VTRNPLFPGRPFELVHHVRDGRRLAAARFVCATCEAKQEFSVGSQGINPEAIVKTAAGLGWEVKLRSERATCPRCAAARRARAKGESPKEQSEDAHRFADILSGAKAGLERAKADRVSAPRFSIPVGHSQKVIPMQSKPSTPTAVTPRTLTDSERLKIRTLLDSHFDDAKGRYLDGYSDQRIAAEVNVPRIHVETIREAGWGPIRLDPEVAAIAEELRKAREEVEALSQRIGMLTARLEKSAGAAA